MDTAERACSQRSVKDEVSKTIAMFRRLAGLKRNTLLYRLVVYDALLAWCGLVAADVPYGWIHL